MNRSNVQIREAASHDVGQLLAIEQRAFSGDLLSRRALRHLVTRAHAISLVAAECPDPLLQAARPDGGERLVGYIIILLRQGTDAGRIYSLAVDPDWRGRKIGARLLDEAQARLQKAGRSLIRLEVRSDNEAALRRYHGAGFEVVGSEIDYYEDGQTAFKMEKRL